MLVIDRRLIQRRLMRADDLGVSNFDQIAVAKERMQDWVPGTEVRVPCGKQISSGNTRERQRS